ncbi:LacI family transcriptional regulator [Herbiconiux sp. CPCC 205716]|uniref:LacI family transcriptional regulator n=1 Tax=Herbiconiux gentiana TaxID=2970912 RepID=A0ABT2GAE2_9MICO|nr:LacI family DNA-binding transcriptional regulator [Herbiconiux gentiana]MCS5713135.1 LacI family transcriptional regulator [Herbiconiux gentiana]
MSDDDVLGTYPMDPASRRVTIDDVARTANVSIGTVSKVINGRRGIGEDTRARVEAVADSLGYVSVFERRGSLRSVGEPTIEVLVEPADVANPYLSLFMGGAMEIAGSLGAGLLMRSIESIQNLPRAAWAQSLVRAGRVGVIEVTSAFSADRENALRAVGLPMVLVDPIDRPRKSTPSIGATNWAGAYEATQYLISLGHNRVAYVGGPPRATCDVIRAHGWAAAMTDAGLPADLDAVLRHSYTFEHGRDAAERLLGAELPPTAIFAGSDISAMGVLEAARRCGLQVPRDLSVVGFDDTYLARTSTPPLTTVHQPIADIGRNAVSSVMRLAGGDPLPAKRIELATHLVVRDSTAPPRP